MTSVVDADDAQDQSGQHPGAVLAGRTVEDQREIGGRQPPRPRRVTNDRRPTSRYQRYRSRGRRRARRARPPTSPLPRRPGSPTDGDRRSARAKWSPTGVPSSRRCAGRRWWRAPATAACHISAGELVQGVAAEQRPPAGHTAVTRRVPSQVAEVEGPSSGTRAGRASILHHGRGPADPCATGRGHRCQDGANDRLRDRHCAVTRQRTGERCDFHHAAHRRDCAHRLTSWTCRHRPASDQCHDRSSTSILEESIDHEEPYEVLATWCVRHRVSSY